LEAAGERYIRMGWFQIFNHFAKAQEKQREESGGEVELLLHHEDETAARAYFQEEFGEEKGESYPLDKQTLSESDEYCHNYGSASLTIDISSRVNSLINALKKIDPRTFNSEAARKTSIRRVQLGWILQEGRRAKEVLGKRQCDVAIVSDHPDLRSNEKMRTTGERAKVENSGLLKEAANDEVLVVAGSNRTQYRRARRERGEKYRDPAFFVDLDKVARKSDFLLLSSTCNSAKFVSRCIERVVNKELDQYPPIHLPKEDDVSFSLFSEYHTTCILVY